MTVLYEVLIISFLYLEYFRRLQSLLAAPTDRIDFLN